MIFFCNAQGTITSVVSSPVYQGSNYANEVIFVAPFASASVVTVSFILPNGTYRSAGLGTSTPISNVVDDNNVAYNAWTYLVPSAFTEYSGTMTAQFTITNGTTVNKTASSSFTVEKGVPNITTDPPEDIYQQILTALSSANTQINNLEENKLDKQSGVASYPQVYGVQNNVQQLYALSDGNTVPPFGAIAQYTENGNLFSQPPVQGSDVTNKEYVDFQLNTKVVSLAGAFAERPIGTYPYVILYTATDLNTTYRLEANTNGSESSNWVGIDYAAVATVIANPNSYASEELKKLQVGGTVYSLSKGSAFFDEYDGTQTGQVYVADYGERFQLIFVGEATDGTYIDFFNTEDDSGKFRTFNISRNDILIVTQCQDNNIFYMWFHDGATPTTYYDSAKIVKFWTSARLGISTFRQNIESLVPTFENADWATIAELSESGEAQNVFNVGDEKTIELTTGEQVTLVILGFNHDDLTAGGKAGMTIGMKELLATKYSMNLENTNGGWDQSEMRTSTMVTLLSQLPSDLQSVIKTVNKKASAGNLSKEIVVSSDKLFLFSIVEILGTINEVYKDEGEQYEYWKTIKDGKVAENRKKHLPNDDDGYGWWTRSPHTTKDGYFWYISYKGATLSNIPSLYMGVSFCFCV